MARIAFYTFAILQKPPGHERVQGFVDLLDPVWNDVEEADGFIARAEPVDLDDTKNRLERDYGKWGEAYMSRFGDVSDEKSINTFTIWKDLQAVYHFTYRNHHAEAMRGRKQWFIDPTYPTHVAWWIEDNHQPTWKEACERHEHLHDNGSTPYAFNFRQPFDENGEAVNIRKSSK